MCKYQIVTLMSKTFLKMKMLQLQMFLRKVQQIQPQSNPHNGLQEENVSKKVQLVTTLVH